MAQALRTSLQAGGLTQGGLRPGLGGDNIFASSALDLNFGMTKSLGDLVTFTRASSGTYVGSDGVLKTATTNLLLQSEDFGTTWTRFAGLQFTANQAIAPNGLTTADLLAGDGTQIGYVEQPTSSSNQFVSGLSYTFSVYLKKANTSTVLTLLYGLTFNSGGSNPIATWNLDTGVPSFSNGCTGSMTAVGNGWYRCVVTDTATATETRNQQWLRMSVNAGDAYVWGAQLEQSSTVGEYIPTTSTINSAPRFDHNPTTGESLGLLVEEQRTNLLLQSEDFSTTWTRSGVLAFGSGSTVNAIAAPSGAVTADLITEDSATSTHVITQGSLSFTSGLNYTVSCFVKRATGTRNVAIQLRAASFSGAPRVNLDLTTGATTITGTGATSGSQAYGNDWWRVWITATATATVSSFVDIGLLSGTTFSYAGDGTSGIYLWGAQLEAGAFPTSYIPTTGATATRSADVASITGTNFSSWYRQDEGTVFAETQLPAGTAVNTSSRSIIDATDGSTNNRVSLRAIASGAALDQLTIRSSAATTAQFGSNGTAISAAARKIAAVYKLDDYAMWATGATSAAIDTSGAIPVGVNQITVGSAVGGSEFMSGTIRRLTFWPARLANSTLQAITQ